MPELPEVETTVKGLQSKVLGRAFVNVWQDWYQKIDIKKIKNKKIIAIYRRAKNIIFDLSAGYSLLIHMKMTGHLLVGRWKIKNKKWKPVDAKSPLNDPYNRFIHLIFFLDNGNMLALSDARKFAKVELYKKEELKRKLEKLGPEPLSNDFTFEKFKKCFEDKRGKIKQILMDPEIIAGIGNIYSSEILWQAKVHPEKSTQNLSRKELKSIFLAVLKILQIAVKLEGESFSDYRKVDGSKGNFDIERRVYKRENEICSRCKKSKIIRKKIGQRSAFFCPICQKL